MHQVVILIDSGIGNAIQSLYAVEYLLEQNIKVGFYLGSINESFQNYLKFCYGEVILDSIEGVQTDILIHGFTYQRNEMPTFKKYLYVSADYHSTRHRTETEQFLEIVRSLFPSNFEATELKGLKETYSELVQKLKIEDKVVLYPGCNAISPSKRWPYFQALSKEIKQEKCVIVGGSEDLNFSYSYFYPKWMTTFLHQKLLNRHSFWKFSKKLNLLQAHAHWESMDSLPNAYINKFSWGELVSVFKRCEKFVGNDGGLSHLASAAGAKGLLLFGPTSVEKNRPFSPSFKILRGQCCCSQFGEQGKVTVTRRYINCPCQIKCLSEISSVEVVKELKKI